MRIPQALNRKCASSPAPARVSAAPCTRQLPRARTPFLAQRRPRAYCLDHGLRFRKSVSSGLFTSTWAGVVSAIRSAGEDSALVCERRNGRYTSLGIPRTAVAYQADQGGRSHAGGDLVLPTAITGSGALLGQPPAGPSDRKLPGPDSICPPAADAMFRAIPAPPRRQRHRPRNTHYLPTGSMADTLIVVLDGAGVAHAEAGGWPGDRSVRTDSIVVGIRWP